MTLRTFIVTGLVGLTLMIGLAACGKRGIRTAPRRSQPAAKQPTPPASLKDPCQCVPFTEMKIRNCASTGCPWLV